MPALISSRKAFAIAHIDRQELATALSSKVQATAEAALLSRRMVRSSFCCTAHRHSVARLRGAMMAVIHRQASVSMGGKVEWKIAAKNIRIVDGTEFVKLAAHDASFVRFVCEGAVSDIPKNATLSHSPGFQQLKDLRNQKQAEELQSSPAQEPKRALFEDEAPPATKRYKRSSVELQELRSSPCVITIDVPGVGGGPPLSIQVLRPVHPCQDIVIKFDPQTIQHIVLFIRESGITTDTVSSKRHYKADDAPQGVWRSGKARGFVVKVPVADADAPDKPYRLKRVKTMDHALKLLNASGEVGGAE